MLRGKSSTVQLTKQNRRKIIVKYTSLRSQFNISLKPFTFKKTLEKCGRYHFSKQFRVEVISIDCFIVTFYCFVMSILYINLQWIVYFQ